MIKFSYYFSNSWLDFAVLDYLQPDAAEAHTLTDQLTHFKLAFPVLWFNPLLNVTPLASGSFVSRTEINLRDNNVLSYTCMGRKIKSNFRNERKQLHSKICWLVLITTPNSFGGEDLFNFPSVVEGWNYKGRETSPGQVIQTIHTRSPAGIHS